MRIIILEEDVGSGGALHERLRPEGAEVLGVRSALEFFRNMAVEDYDIAIVDVGLPDADRLEIVSSLRSKRGIGIITLTSRNEARDRIACFENGADLHFARPVDTDELLHGVRSLAAASAKAGLAGRRRPHASNNGPSIQRIGRYEPPMASWPS